MRTEVVLPSSISKNRVYIPYINKIKRVFSFLGFSYRSNKWYFEKINNIMFFINLKSLSYRILFFFALFFYFNFFFSGDSFLFFIIWKSIELIEMFFTTILLYVYCFLIFLKKKIFSYIFKKNILNSNNLNKFDKNYVINNFQNEDINKFLNLKITKEKLLFFKYLFKSSEFENTKIFEKRPLHYIDFLVLKEKTTKTTNKFLYENNELLNYYFFKNIHTTSKINNKNYFYFYYNNILYMNFKNFKFNQWLSKYHGLNSTTYNYFYNLNFKFNYLNNKNTINSFDIYKKLNISETLFDYKNINTSYRYNDFLKINTFNSYFKDNYFNIVGNSWFFNKINIFQLLNNNNPTMKLTGNFNFNNLGGLINTNKFNLFVKNNLNNENKTANNYNFEYYNIRLNKNLNNCEYDNVNNLKTEYFKKLFFFKKF